MSKKTCAHTTVRHDWAATRREQALCLAALDSHEYDKLSDDQWVSLCEKIGKELAREAQQNLE